MICSDQCLMSAKHKGSEKCSDILFKFFIIIYLFILTTMIGQQQCIFIKKTASEPVCCTQIILKLLKVPNYLNFLQQL